MKAIALLAACLILASAIQARAELTVDMVGANGTLPGSSITYTVTSVGGTERDIFPAGSSINGVFQWVTPFSEFEATNAITTTISFSAPVPVDRIVAGVSSIVNSGTGFNLSLSGGTATTNDFTLSDAIPNNPGGAAGYDPTTGNFSTSKPPVRIRG